MSWLNTTVLVFHVLLAVGLVGLVLLQRGKGADAGAGFGAGASGTVFGARGSASFLSRTTAVLALLFFVSSLSLAYLGGRHAAPSSVVDRVQPLVPAQPDPLVPATLPRPGAAGSPGSVESTQSAGAPASSTQSGSEQGPAGPAPVKK